MNKTSLNAQLYSLNNVIVKLVETTKIINSIPGLRNYLPFLAPIFAFFDDFWYYIYQHNDLDGLSIIPVYLNIMYQVNQDRPFP